MARRRRDRQNLEPLNPGPPFSPPVNPEPFVSPVINPEPIIPPAEELGTGPEGPLSEDLARFVPVRPEVNVRLAQPPGINPTLDQGLWIAIRHTAQMTSFEHYREFIDRVLCQGDGPRFDFEGQDGEIAGLIRTAEKSHSRGGLGLHAYGVNAYNILRLATETFLLMRCGVAIRGHYRPDWDEARLYQRFSAADARGMLQGYLREPGAILPYLEQVFNALDATDRQTLIPGRDDVNSPFCIVPLIQRITAPCLIELIWSYWHEQGMLVQTMNAISMRFQNKRSGAVPGIRWLTWKLTLSARSIT